MTTTASVARAIVTLTPVEMPSSEGGEAEDRSASWSLLSD
jgi:hypothetical protein